jgi:hypothetical protein
MISFKFNPHPHIGIFTLSGLKTAHILNPILLIDFVPFKKIIDEISNDVNVDAVPDEAIFRFDTHVGWPRKVMRVYRHLIRVGWM